MSVRCPQPQLPKAMPPAIEAWNAASESDARIAVLPPGAADFLVLLDDHMIVTGTLQLDPGEDAGQARADDQHLEASRRRRAAGQFLAGGAALEAALFDDHRDELVVHRLADADAHHLLHQFDRRIFRLRRARRCQHMDQLFVQVVDAVLRDLIVGIGIGRMDVDLEGLQHRFVMRQVHIDHQQGLEIGRL